MMSPAQIAEATAEGLEDEAKRNEAVGWKENAMLFYAEARGARKVAEALKAIPSTTSRTSSERDHAIEPGRKLGPSEIGDD